MSFWKRFRMYLLGVGLGVVLVYLFFGKEKTENALWGWLPKNAIKKEMTSYDLKFNHRQISCFNDCSSVKVDSLSLFNVLKHGDVDFSLSDTRKFPKKYVFNNDNQSLKFTFIKQDSLNQSILIKIENQDNIECKNCFK